MNSKLKRLLSSALAAITVMSTVLTSAFAVGVSASDTAAKDPKEIERVVVDCRSAEAFAKTSSVYVHTPTETEPDPYTGGKYSFHEAMSAMSIDYNPINWTGRQYRVLTKFNQKGTITEDYKYFVIVYAAKATEPYTISVWNGAGAGPEVKVVTEGHDTKAKFVVSEPYDISTKGSNGQSTLSRWINGPHSTIAFITSEKDARFFIKEYSFFKSAEDAKAYYAGVDLSKDPLEYGENAVKPTTETAATAVEPPKFDAPSAEAGVEVAPVYVNFATSDDLGRNAQARVFGGENEGLGGAQEFVTLADGTKCMQILAHKYTGKPSAGSSDYRMMLAFKNKDLVSVNHKYVRITYMTTNTEKNTITLTNNASGKSAVLVSDTSASNGKFVTSAPVEISEAGLAARLNAGSHCSLEYKNTAKEPVIYIKEMFFFGTKEQAEAYDPSKEFDLSMEYNPGAAPASPTAPATPAAPADPNNNVFNVTNTEVEEVKTVVSGAEVAPVIVDFSTQETLKKNANLRKWTDANAGLGGLQEFVTLEDGTQCMKMLPHEYTGKASAGSSSLYRMMLYITDKSVTENHRYMCVTYMTTDRAPHTITLTNNASGSVATLVPNTSISCGEFVRSAPVDIYTAGLTTRYASGNHCSFQFVSASEDTEVYIKEIGFFSSPEQAYEYYGDEIDDAQITYKSLSFGEIGTGIVKRKDTWGNSVDLADAVEISYAAKTEWNNVHYRVDVAGSTELMNGAGPYVRVLYSAENPADVKKATMFLRNNATGATFVLSDNVVNTNGEYVLSDVALVNDVTFSRFSKVQVALIVNALSEGGKYNIKEMYFFNSREDAEAFQIHTADTELLINGNDISKYQIVVSKDAPDNVKTAADSIAMAIGRLCPVDVPVVTDDQPISEYEILVGKSNRPLSTFNMDKILAAGSQAYGIFIEGNTLIITADLGLCVVTAAGIAKDSLFYEGLKDSSEAVDITPKFNMIDVDPSYKVVEYWLDGAPVHNPDVVTVDFETDEGYFNEDNGEKNWKLENGAYKTDATDFASSYLHAYEKNFVYKAKLTYTAENDGSMGLMARVNAEHAYIKAGYDFKAGEWYIESRDGRDFFLEKVATKAATIAPDTAYELVLTADDDYFTLSVNGETVIENAKVTHASPGRFGVYAENASVAVDDIEITLVSGQSTVWQNVSHTKIPYDSYMEGATVHKRDDGSLNLVNPYGIHYKSIDGGKSWQKTEAWSDNHAYSYSNMIRLNDGSFLRVGQENVNGESYKVARISTDDGETWGTPYPICDAKYKKTTTALGSNMNDKITQFPANSKYPNRIFYCQTYEVNSSWSSVPEVDGRVISGQFFYSDDNGKTWTKSETDTWTIPGIENEKYVSECKILICEDGTVRVYCSWNQLGCIIYADSNDGGKTFGPAQYMDEFYCPASSMQFVRDPYAENDYTYYMVWVYADDVSNSWHQPRYRLSLAKTTDGKNWVYLGDIWRWESTWSVGDTLIPHIVDPFVYVTEDYVICGSGFSESRKISGEGGPAGHQGQRQHIFTIAKDTLPEGKVLNKFTDVEVGAPYYEAVTFVTSEGLFQGTGDISFSPNANMTRSMFVTVLGRLNGADMSAYATPTFSDVVAGQWYTSYVEWAAANSIVNGLGNDIYGINDNVTVQQACVILARYANYATAAEGTGKTAADFADSANVADWATKEVEWALANGVYTGMSDKINPDAPASRAVVAEMFNNYVKVFGK